MNGWQRLGVVIGTFLAVPVGLITYEDSKSVYTSHYPSPEVAELAGQEWVNGVFYEAKRENKDLSECVLETTRVSSSEYSEGATITCERRWSSTLSDALLFALIPYGLVFGLGYVVAWVYRGFRPAPDP